MHENKLEGLPHLLQYISRNQGEDMKIMENKRRAAEEEEEMMDAHSPNDTTFKTGDMLWLNSCPRAQRRNFCVSGG